MIMMMMMIIIIIVIITIIIIIIIIIVVVINLFLITFVWFLLYWFPVKVPWGSGGSG